MKHIPGGKDKNGKISNNIHGATKLPAWRKCGAFNHRFQCAPKLDREIVVYGHKTHGHAWLCGSCKAVIQVNGEKVNLLSRGAVQ